MEIGCSYPRTFMFYMKLIDLFLKGFAVNFYCGFMPPRRHSKPTREIILEFMRKANRPVRVKEIASGTGINYNTVRGRLQELKKRGLVEVCEGGWKIR